MRVLFTGDSMLVSDLSHRPKGFDELVAVILSSDVAFTNLEVTIPSASAFCGKYWKQGIPAAASVRSIELLQEIGIDGVSFANNHSFDWGTMGLLDTIEGLKETGMPFTGAGINKTEAKRPLSLDIKGERIGLLGITSSYPDWGIALDGIEGFPGKPGIYTLEIQRKPLISFGISFFDRHFKYASGGGYLPNGYILNK